MLPLLWPSLDSSHDVSHNSSALAWGVSLFFHDHRFHHDDVAAADWTRAKLIGKPSATCQNSEISNVRDPDLSKKESNVVQDDGQVSCCPRSRNARSACIGGHLSEQSRVCGGHISGQSHICGGPLSTGTSDLSTQGVVKTLEKSPEENRRQNISNSEIDKRDTVARQYCPSPATTPPPRESRRNSGKMVGINGGANSANRALSPVCHSHSTDLKADLLVKIILLGDYSVGKSSLLRVLARHSDYDLNQNNEDDDSAETASVRSSFRGNSLPRNGSLGKSGSLGRDGSLNRNSSQGRRQTTTQHGTLVKSCQKPGGFVEVEFTHHDKTVLARISDTGGQERYRSMTTSYYRGAHGCLLMFDVTKEESFENLDSWLENIDAYKTVDDFPVIIVATRCHSPARRIPYERAEDYAANRGLPYMELDMDHMTDVRRVFEALLDSVTLSLCRHAPLTINIRPDITGKSLHVRKSVACSC